MSNSPSTTGRDWGFIVFVGGMVVGGLIGLLEGYQSHQGYASCVARMGRENCWDIPVVGAALIGVILGALLGAVLGMILAFLIRTSHPYDDKKVTPPRK